MPIAEGKLRTVVVLEDAVDGRAIPPTPELRDHWLALLEQSARQDEEWRALDVAREVDEYVADQGASTAAARG